MLSLIISFFSVALTYSLVGFGGGSTYIAILGSFSTPYEMIPKIALFCNILVVCGGCWHFCYKGDFRLKLIVPLCFSSIPMSYIGGKFVLSEKKYIALLAISLILSALRIFFIKVKKKNQIKAPLISWSILTGLVLGLLSGMVGIGGGIFLSPILRATAFSKA